MQPRQGVSSETSLGLKGDVTYQRTFPGFDEPLVFPARMAGTT